MLDREAIQLVFEAFPKALFVCSNGYLSREAFALRDRPATFYMLGSMGLAASIGLGLALSKKERRVVVLDGDGNVLMGLGTLALIGAQQPANLYHVCLDNAVYASTGNQGTISRSVCLEGIAREAGYAHADRADDANGAARALAKMAAAPGPAFLRLELEAQPHPRQLPRVSHTPLELRDRFMAAVAEQQ